MKKLFIDHVPLGTSSEAHRIILLLQLGSKQA